MPATLHSGRSGPPWLKWAAPLAALVLVMSVAGGVAARALYGQSTGNASPTPSTPPPREPGSARVTMSAGAARHPDHAAVRILLQTYFDSINIGRYDRWKTTVIPAKQRQQPESEWLAAYESTTDGSIKIHRITGVGGDSLRVLLSFTSVQDPADAPGTMQVGCLRWRMVYPVVRYAGGLRLGVGLPENALFRPC